MIVAAADYVGMHVVKHLCDHGIKIQYLVLDSEDRGGYNDSMKEAVLKANPTAIIWSENNFSDKGSLQELREQQFDLGILAWWPRIISQEQISTTKRGFVNTHPGLLPYNRGRHPYFWSIVDQTPFGVTLHYVDANIDSGPIIAQEEIPVSWTDTGETLYQKSREKILQLFYQYLGQILENTAPVQPQRMEEGTFHYGKELEPFCRIDLDETYSPRMLFNILRGRMFNGKGAAGFSENGKQYLVSITITEENECNRPIRGGGS